MNPDQLEIIEDIRDIYNEALCFSDPETKYELDVKHRLLFLIKQLVKKIATIKEG